MRFTFACKSQPHREYRAALGPNRVVVALDNTPMTDHVSYSFNEALKCIEKELWIITGELHG